MKCRQALTLSIWQIDFNHFIGDEGPQREHRYSSTLFQTSKLKGSEGSASRPGRTLPPGKTRYPLQGRLGGPQGRSGRWKILPHRDFFYEKYLLSFLYITHWYWNKTKHFENIVYLTLRREFDPRKVQPVVSRYND